MKFEKMTEDRKRLFISIGAALILHVIVLIMTGMSRPDYESVSDFGPITVEISLDRPEQAELPEPEPEDLQNLEAEAPPEIVTEADPVPAAVPVPDNTVKQSPQPAAAAEASVQPGGYKPETIDESFIEALKQRSSTGGIDARAVFGDDRVPSSTDRPELAAAAGASDGSEVVWSDVPASVSDTILKPAEEPAEFSVIDAGDLSSLDEQLSADVSDASTDENSTAVTTSEQIVAQTGNVPGQATSLKFDNPANSRKLITWLEPEIPADVQTAGISRYVVVIEFDIDSDGVTSGFLIRQTSADSRIDSAVRKALRAWGFESSSAGKKVRATLTYVIEIK